MEKNYEIDTYNFFNNEYLTEANLMKIHNNKWLNSSIINEFIELLIETYPSTENKLIINSMFLSVICWYIKEGTYAYKDLENILKKKYKTQNLFSFEIIYIIANLPY